MWWFCDLCESGNGVSNAFNLTSYAVSFLNLKFQSTVSGSESR